jgi:glycerate kinase
MRIMLAPDSFKGSLSAEAAAHAMAEGTADAGDSHDLEICPISDGGEGFVAALATAAAGEVRRVEVLGPLGDPVSAAWALLPDRTAVIETAAAAGLTLVPEGERDPLLTSTFGLGQVMVEALDHGCKRIIVGLGGSATNDGGAGLAQALGYRFHDHENRPITTPLSGGGLHQIGRIDAAGRHPRLADTEVVAACDVDNPLTGPRGASVVYGPQKGASKADVEVLDAGLAQLAERLRRELSRDVAGVPGAGAAGGLGAGLLAFADAKLRPGIDLVLDAVDFERRVAGCDLCLTGEGRLDGQSLSGKAILGVCRIAQKHGVPTRALVGSVDDDADILLQHGLTSYHVISRGHPTAYAMAHANTLLREATAALLHEVAGR